MMHQARILHVSIEASPQAVYDFASRPENMALWAPNFGRSMNRSGSEWVMETPEGPFRVRFEAPNPFGVLDHWVTAPDGSTFFNPVRVVANGDQSLVSFTLFHQPSWSAERREADAELVLDDLRRLKALLETAA